MAKTGNFMTPNLLEILENKPCLHISRWIPYHFHGHFPVLLPLPFSFHGTCLARSTSRRFQAQGEQRRVDQPADWKIGSFPIAVDQVYPQWALKTIDYRRLPCGSHGPLMIKLMIDFYSYVKWPAGSKSCGESIIPFLRCSCQKMLKRPIGQL